MLLWPKIRLLFGIGCVGAASWLVVPPLIYPCTSQAIINTELVSLASPIGG